MRELKADSSGQKNITDNLEEADVEGFGKVGRPFGKTCRRIAISVKTETHNDAKVAALHLGLSLSSVISDLLAVWLKSDAVAPVLSEVLQAKQRRNTSAKGAVQ